MYLSIIFKTIILYVYIVVVYKIMGKKEVGKLSIIDLIVSILIAELAAISIENYDDSILISIIPILILVIIQIVISFISVKMPKVKKIIDGEPAVLIKKGKINFKEMVKLRYGVDDLIAQLREQSIKSLDEVDYAVLENNGKLSTFSKCKDYPLPIIVDAVVDYDVLSEINKDEKWLNKLLHDNKLELNDVYYAFYKGDKTVIIKKSDLI